MAKKPYIEFYPGDWSRDAGVRKLSLDEKGGWLEILIAMDDNDPRGELQGNVQGLSRLLGVDDITGFRILDSIITNKVCDTIWQNDTDSAEWSNVFLNLSNDCLDKIPFFWLTLRNRRMWREEAEKRKWREDKKKQRENMSDDCPSDVHPSRARSSSSSSSSKKETSCDISATAEKPQRAAGRKKPVNLPRYSESFLQGKAAYPSRGSGGQNYPAASENWAAWVGQQLPDGTVLTDDDLIRACRNYHRAMEAAGNIGKPYVLQMATFLSRQEPRFIEYLSADFVVETAPRSCATCANGQGYCKHIHRTPDSGEGPCENYREAK